MSASQNNNGGPSPPREQPKKEDDQAASATSAVNTGTGHQNNAASNTNGIADESQVTFTQEDIDKAEELDFNEDNALQLESLLRPNGGNSGN
ncbi:uncharacterized protein PV06_11754 [Exophiala oligosperma]|uniref:Uncharacterized protein n=2 Tax=Chaetothyriales TaxID=34395 RepID=A0A0D2CXX7_9EURO|nr:uncharacterized protein PV06_11754 [Exophiala oligosperma]KAJ9609295.1 hypothetical protein H2204_015570 [Knufia peltigerae]KIW35928.1 hypothetical protein PV06_11754 [Exophiala oligosperma]